MAWFVGAAMTLVVLDALGLGGGIRRGDSFLFAMLFFGINVGGWIVAGAGLFCLLLDGVGSRLR
jgi:hypothetical protein